MATQVILCTLAFVWCATGQPGHATNSVNVCGHTWARVEIGGSTWKDAESACRMWNTDAKVLCNFVGSNECTNCLLLRPNINTYFEWSRPNLWSHLGTLENILTAVLKNSSCAFNGDVSGNSCHLYGSPQSIVGNIGNHSSVQPSSHAVCVVKNATTATQPAACPNTSTTTPSPSTSALSAVVVAVIIILTVVACIIFVVFGMNLYKRYANDRLPLPNVHSGSISNKNQLIITTSDDNSHVEPTVLSDSSQEQNYQRLSELHKHNDKLPRNSTTLKPGTSDSEVVYAELSRDPRMKRVETKGKALGEFSRQHRMQSVISMMDPRPTLTADQLPDARDFSSMMTRGMSYSNLIYKSLPGSEMSRTIRGYTIENKPDMRHRQKTVSDFPPPDLLNADHIRVGPKIAGGAFADVLLGVYEHVFVAIKMLRETDDDTIDDEDNRRAAMTREMKLFKNLRGAKHVAQIFGFCDNPFCLVMEYYANLDVRKLVYGKNPALLSIFPNGEIPLDTRVRFCYEAAKGMRELHHRGIVHRDIAARNLLLDSELSVHVSDFGMSRLVKKNGAVTLSHSGPLKWMAPESLKFKRWDEGTDIYMFAVTMWEIFHGREPWSNYTPFNAAVRVMNDDARPPKERPPINSDVEVVPVAIKELIQKCWDVRSRRPLNFKTITSKLGGILEDYGGHGARTSYNFAKTLTEIDEKDEDPDEDDLDVYNEVMAEQSKLSMRTDSDFERDEDDDDDEDNYLELDRLPDESPANEHHPSITISQHRDQEDLYQDLPVHNKT